MFSIYKITVLESGKHYIGCTSQTVERRVYEHQHKKEYAFSLLPHSVETLCTTEDFEKAQILEAYYIDQFDSCNPEKGYNRRLGGSKSSFPDWVNVGFGKRNNPRTFGGLGNRHSEEAKDKIRQARLGKPGTLLGRKLSEEMKAQKALKRDGKGYVKGSSHHWFGKQKTQEEKAKLRALQIEQQRVHGNPYAGKKHSDETRLKMKMAWEKRKLLPSTRIGKIHNEETKQKMKEAWVLRRLKMKPS